MVAVTQLAGQRLLHRAQKQPVAQPHVPLIVGDGCSDSVWLPWLQTLPIKEVTLHGLVPAGKRLVVVAPHPDDEILACGALMALQIQSGGEVLVVYVTDGDASHGQLDAAARQRLAETRRLESSQGLSILGAGRSAVVRLAIPDGAVGRHAAQLWSSLLQVLQLGDVVVTTWSRDGHPDHEASARATLMAGALVGCEVIEAPVWMWHWSQPDDARVPFDSLAALSVTPAIAQAKLNALQCHESQLKANQHREEPVLGRAICQRATRPVEYYFASKALFERL